MEPIANRVGKPAPDEAQIIFQKIRSEFMRLIGKYLKGFNFTRSGFIFRRTVGGDVQMIEFQHAWLVYRLSAGVLFDGFEMNGYSGMRGYPRIDDGVGVGLSQLVDGYPTAVPYRLEDIDAVERYLSEIINPWLDKASRPEGSVLFLDHVRVALDEMWASRGSKG